MKQECLKKNNVLVKEGRLLTTIEISKEISDKPEPKVSRTTANNYLWC